MADLLPSRENGHLAVAAIRILRHREGRPPTPQEVAALLGWTEEETRVVLRGLSSAGILSVHETPFEIRFEITAHEKVDALPAEASKEALESEVENFRQRALTKQEQLERMLLGGEMDKKKKEKLDNLEKEFADFKKKKPGPPI